jgi:hypothetical protein
MIYILPVLLMIGVTEKELHPNDIYREFGRLRFLFATLGMTGGSASE